MSHFEMGVSNWDMPCITIASQASYSQPPTGGKTLKSGLKQRLLHDNMTIYMLSALDN
ncbi:hypothetical protein Desor_3670 [Desulfosporosinus orientis DSM 765]|uniref:Uncharacterized protein n=1 Tax=Desulfosporosinus orientis (strain ATCC 19365 / DSM 765 / NCIMB 8382 / VKM B-1628 / Singapore I) TaxID=768706 RepID=G7WIS3_DESOD|nr:hypothetical protein Desor_3670 [Desulfosporosinus orientis DSM 765]